jgi:hypothetical protein
MLIDLTSLPSGQSIYWDEERKELWEIIGDKWLLRPNNAQWPTNLPKVKDIDIEKAIKALKAEVAKRKPRITKKGEQKKDQLNLF